MQAPVCVQPGLPTISQLDPFSHAAALVLWAPDSHHPGPCSKHLPDAHAASGAIVLGGTGVRFFPTLAEARAHCSASEEGCLLLVPVAASGQLHHGSSRGSQGPSAAFCDFLATACKASEVLSMALEMVSQVRWVRCAGCGALGALLSGSFVCPSFLVSCSKMWLATPCPAGITALTGCTLL